MLCIVQLLALGAALGWWLTLTPQQRARQMWRIMYVEHAQSSPPITLWSQSWWLCQHRLQRLRGMTGLSALACLMGLIEGWERRRNLPFRGIGFFRLALGQWISMLTLGYVAGYVVLPWPLPPVPVAIGLAFLTGGALYFLAAGKPLIR
jgi:hypothetical protein